MLAPTIDIIDAHQFGSPRTGAIYVVRGKDLALVESGTAVSAERTLAKLKELAQLKTSAATPTYIFLTHIHLDHAGGAGRLSQAFPKAKIVVHERAVRHLIDPSRLVEAVRIASPNLFHQYGEPLPIPEHQLVPVSGGEIFDLGSDIQVETVASPGHAPHHICYYERANRTLFTGDAAGNWSNPVDVPLTPPPRFDLARGLETLRTLQLLKPDYLAFTHFGLCDEAASHLARYESQLIAWFDDIRQLMESLGPADIIKKILERPCYCNLQEAEQSIVEMCVRGAILSLESGSA